MGEINRLGQLAPGGEDNLGQLAPGGGGGGASQPRLLAPRRASYPGGQINWDTGRIYNLCANHTSNSGLTETLCRAQAILYALPNNERVPNIVG